MAKTKAEEKVAQENKSPRKRQPVRQFPFQFFEKNHNKKSMESRFQNKIQTAIKGTENTVTTDTGKLIHRKFISEPITFQTEKARRKSDTVIEDEIAPNNRHKRRGVDGKYSKRNEVLKDILAGKFKIVPNSRRKPSDSEMEEGEDDDDDSDFDNYDTSERGVYKPIQTNVNTEDELHIHTDGELHSKIKTDIELENQNTEKQIRRSNRESKQTIKYGGVNYTKNFWG